MGLTAERPPAAELIDVALACGMWELRPRAMSAGDWLSEIDPIDEIAALPELAGEELIGGRAAWRDNYRVVKAELFARMEPRREGWALRMRGSAQVLKGAGKIDWKTFTGMAKAVLDGRALETAPIMEYVWERTNRVLVNEELLQGRE